MTFAIRSTVSSSVLRSLLAGVMLACFSAPPASAEISSPDFTFYGGATLDGVPAPSGVTVTLVIDGDLEPIAAYAMGTDEDLDVCKVGVDLCYALRVPMDSDTPRQAGRARPGDEVSLFVDGQLAGTAVVGAVGGLEELDLDPETLPGMPTLSVVDAAGAENLAGPHGLVVEVELQLSFATDRPVTVSWQTVDGTAIAGSDYQVGSGQATIGVGATTTTMAVTIFDDAVAEAGLSNPLGEAFSVVLSDPTEANLLDPIGLVTILDDDTEPVLSIANLTVVEPPEDAVEAAFTVSLDHAWDQDVTFDYSAVFGSAAAADFDLPPGSGVIPAGSLATDIVVRVLADSESEAAEIFNVELASPVSATVRPGGGQGTIVDDARFLTYVERQLDGEPGIDSLAGAIDVATSPDGAHLYTVARGDDALTVFSRDAVSGRLILLATYANGVGGLDGLGGLEAVAVSPSGDRVYAAAFNDGALAVFRRDPSSGVLTLLEIEREGQRDQESGDDVEGLGGAAALAVVADLSGGEHLYVAGSQGDSVAVFHRDAASGLLSFADVVRDGDPGGVDGLDQVLAAGSG